MDEPVTARQHAVFVAIVLDEVPLVTLVPELAPAATWSTRRD
jgi:hypothetical protein